MLYLLERALCSKAKGNFFILATRNFQPAGALSSKAKGSFLILATRNFQPAGALSSKAKGNFLILATRNRQLPLTLLLNFLTAGNV
jgi:hypothetical protein